MNNRPQKLKPIMFVGTGSDVGKSVINAAFCRIFKQDGYSPAPFKAQNMSLNSFATSDGLEIGRAQAVQAEACGIDCTVEMNPVLLKPTSYLSSQVVLKGKPVGNSTAYEYFIGTDREQLFREAIGALKVLENKYNPIVIEGAGSISEINLWEKDITNMRIALEAGADTYLIADIDKGGVFGCVYGTLKLLPEDQNKLIKGIIINKFRGDISLFSKGKAMLEELTGKPVVGMIPYFRDIIIEQEDSVVIEKKQGTNSDDKINIAVILLPHLSNFTDFNMLEQQPGVNLFYSNNPKEIREADIVIIPGSKNTISDLLYIGKRGVARTISDMHKEGKQVYGICGGFQMMGKEIRDPYFMEGEIEKIPALGILPVTTVITERKKTVQTTFTFLGYEQKCQGYEIHMGTTKADTKKPVCRTESEDEGFMLNEKTWGTYMHGIFDNQIVVEHILKQVKKDVKVQMDYNKFKDNQYNKLARLVRESVDMEYIYKNMAND